MYIPYKTKQSGFYKELPSDNHEIFFAIIEKKILPTIDNIYYNVFIEDDGSERTMQKILPLLEILHNKKAKAKEIREPQPFSNGLHVTLKSAGKSMFDVCLTEPDIYDIFVNSGKLPNDLTPRIHNQLRSFGLWTRSIDSVLDESLRKTEAILADYDLKISHVQENRIDYCYHTNIKSDVDKIFDKRKKDFRHLKYSLDGGFGHFANKKNDCMFFNYYMFGNHKGDWLARFYDKVKEVIENGYKSFFFKMWHDNGLISFYDRYCMEYALEHKNFDYTHKAKLAFYVEFGDNDTRRKIFDDALQNKNKSLLDYKKIADEFMPPTNPVINIEFQTHRDFYRHSDDWINRRETLERDCHPQLKRIYQIIDNRRIFLEHLTGRCLFFADGKNADGTPNYLDWWKRIHK
ncbi:MAG: hypothetical protein FWD19_02625, partial [Defluviitaleaceae bacterium]|nr:hypothetical protein [Defluviitaleaceae bacterium]